MHNAASVTVTSFMIFRTNSNDSRKSSSSNIRKAVTKQFYKTGVTNSPYPISDQIYLNGKFNLRSLSWSNVVCWYSLRNEPTSKTYTRDYLTKNGCINLSGIHKLLEIAYITQFFIQMVVKKDKNMENVSRYKSQVVISRTVNYTKKRKITSFH